MFPIIQKIICELLAQAYWPVHGVCLLFHASTWHPT